MPHARVEDRNHHPHSSLKKFRCDWSAIAGVLLALCVCVWPATGHADVISDWNRLTMKLEPPRAFTPLSRAAALVHVAMHDAINAIPDQRRYATYLPPVPAPPGASAEAAAVAAARQVMLRYARTVHPENTGLVGQIEAQYATSLAAIPDGPAKEAGLQVGEAAGERLWSARDGDGWNNPEQVPFIFPEPAPGVWRPVSPWAANHLPPFYWWYRVTPWTLHTTSQFLPPPPPDITSKGFLEDVAETRAYGASQSTVRTADQSFAAQWWGVCEETSTAGVVGLMAAQLVAHHGVDLYDSARIFALVTLAQADAMISNIDSKTTWSFWRPITVIRESGAPDWTPYLVTPPNQEYPAGHPMVSGSGLYMLGLFFGLGELAQPLHVTSPNCGTRTFHSLNAAVAEVINARIWGGMHYRHSGDVGARTGMAVAHWVHATTLRPLAEAQ